jgi:predicted amidohydrolase
VVAESELVRVAISQASPLLLDRDASLDRAVQIIGAAASKGASLLAFGEAWLPGYPLHALLAAGTELWWELAGRYLEQAVDFSSAVIDALCSAAQGSGIDLIIGLVECDEVTRGSLYSSLAFIDREGQVMARHRKLRAAPHERAVFADGDAMGLQVHKRNYATLSGLIGCEHQMVLPTYALAEQGAQIHAACWPGFVAPGGSSSLWPDQHLLSRAFALQTGAYVLCAGVSITPADIPEPYRGMLAAPSTGASVIIDPRGDIIAGPVEGDELVIANCSLAAVRAAKIAFDCAGHSARRDQLALLNYAQQQSTEPMLGDAETGGEQSFEQQA